MVSLLHLADITEEGVTFQSPIDGERMLLTPEHSMNIQNQLGTWLCSGVMCGVWLYGVWLCGVWLYGVHRLSMVQAPITFMMYIMICTISTCYCYTLIITGADIMMALDDVVPSTTQDPARCVCERECVCVREREKVCECVCV